MKILRKITSAHDAWPRDARAQARRDRIEVLLAQIEPEPVTRAQQRERVRAIAELQEWMTREREFIWSGLFGPSGGKMRREALVRARRRAKGRT